MSEFNNNTEEDNPKKKAKSDTEEQQVNNPYTNLSLVNPDEIQENLLLYEPKHKVGDKFMMNDIEYKIGQIRKDYHENKETFLKKYVFVPSKEKIPSVYVKSAYEIDRMIDMKPIRERKGQPLGGKHKSRKRRRRKSKKSRKTKK